MVRDKYVYNTEPLRQSTYMCLGALADRIRVEKDKLNKQLLQKEKQIKALHDVENRKFVQSQLQSKLTHVQDQLEQTSAVFSKLKMEILKVIISINIAVNVRMSNSAYTDRMIWNINNTNKQFECIVYTDNTTDKQFENFDYIN